MGLFYDRTETDQEIVIKYTRQPIFYLVLLLAFASVFLHLDISIQYYISFGLIAFAAVYLIDIMKPKKEISEAMKSGSVEISGSKFSFSKPRTVRIRK